jgi:hypothetical protein
LIGIDPGAVHDEATACMARRRFIRTPRRSRRVEHIEALNRDDSSAMFYSLRVRARRLRVAARRLDRPRSAVASAAVFRSFARGHGAMRA